MITLNVTLYVGFQKDITFGVYHIKDDKIQDEE